MKDQLLDDDFLKEEKIKPQLAFLNWIPIVLLWMGIFLCVVNGLFSKMVVLLALGSLIIATVTSYINFNIGAKITLGIIIIGNFKIIQFFPFSIVVYFLGFPLEIFMSIICLIHFYFNRNILLEFLGDFFNNDISEEDIKTQERERINRFKNRFSKNTIRELKAMLENESLLDEAKKAAKELLEERNDDESNI